MQTCSLHLSHRWSAAGLPTSADKQPHKVEQEMHCCFTRSSWEPLASALRMVVAAHGGTGTGNTCISKHDEQERPWEGYAWQAAFRRRARSKDSGSARALMGCQPTTRCRQTHLLNICHSDLRQLAAN